jgi:thymidylate synthase ThyX
MLTIEWQALTPDHGYDLPDEIVDADLVSEYDETMERSAALYDALVERFDVEAPYAVALAYRVRFAMQMNAREAMHLIELRTSQQGHPSYRRVGQEMHRLIEQQAGHRAIAEAMRYVDHGDYELERLGSERAAAARRAAR